MNYQKYYSNQIHSSSLLCQLAQMWRTQMLCDAVIKTGNVTTKAHRLVLVAACPMLQSMDNASIGSHLEVRLASEIKQDSINMFLQYLYEGFMLLTEENARDIEKIARLLQVDSVIKCCADFNKSLHEKTGLPVYSPAQYKYTFHDMLEFKHVRVSGIQKSMLEGAMKRNASEFSRPGSPGSKRQRMHRPGSPSLEGASHRADDTLSMSDSYRSSHQPAEPWDRVPRLGSGMSRGRNIQPGVIEIIEDSLELVQTEPVEKDPVTGRPIESRQPVQKSVAISVASQVTGSDPDLQIINVTGVGSEGGSHSQPASTSTTSTSSSRGNRTVSDPSLSSSASARGGDMQSSPRISSSDRSFLMAGPSPRTEHQRHLQVQHQQFQNEQRIQQQNAFGGFGQIELEPVSHIPGLTTKPKPPEPHHSIPQKNQFSHGPPALQSKPFAAGSAHQVAAQGSAAPPTSQGSSSSVSQISIPPISPVASELSPFSGPMASPGSKNRNVPSSSSNRADSIERPGSVERPKDTSTKPKSGTSTPITDELTPDISIVKVESTTEKVIDTMTSEVSDTGGLDMFVDAHGDEGMPPQVLDDDNDQTYEGSDYDVEEPPGEGSNEGSNLSGDQNSSWYLNTMKGTKTEEQKGTGSVPEPRYSQAGPYLQAHGIVPGTLSEGVTLSEQDIYTSSSEAAQNLFSCYYCAQKFVQAEEFQKHLVAHDSGFMDLCLECGKGFKSSSGYKNHLRLRHSDKTLCHPCEICGKFFVNISMLRIHERSHSDQRNFTCLTCGKSYKHKKNLQGHNCVTSEQE